MHQAASAARDNVAAGRALRHERQLAVDGKSRRGLARPRIGFRNLPAEHQVHPGAVLGSDGFGLANDGGVWVKVPQLGGVRIGDDVEIGANTTVDCGAIEDTVIEDGVRIEDLNSTNGTLVDGRKISRIGLGGRQEIKIGKHILDVRTPDSKDASSDFARTMKIDRS